MADQPRSRKTTAALVALGLLTVAFPGIMLPLVGALVATVVAVVGWVIGNFSLACALAAGALLAYAFPMTLRRVGRWLSRAWVASVTAVFPKAI
ncbi:hypothetical protein ACIP9H_33905 [Streptomyces sp. NPDC088732]|uniref:hypothetical protein n=1 Tax=Streptomyces sp. NPDC088732 TaxID=3365879 RepID=UPI00380D4AF1